MAEYYLDHGAYGDGNNPIQTVPAWGVAQDGDGLLPTLATPSTASIVFSAAPTSGVISVSGVTVSTTGVLNAASADAAANALATNINATTTVVSGNGFASSQQLRNCVYARGPSGGAPAGTCEIMTRAGSANFNGLVAVASTFNNVSGSSSLSWSGGVSGCWGTAWNWFVTTGVSGSIANRAYGAFARTVLVGPAAINNGDVLRVRTDRNVVFNVAASSGSGVFDKFGESQSSGNPVTILFDNGTAWADPNGVVKLSSSGAKGNSNGISFTTQSFIVLKGVEVGEAYSIKIENAVTSGQTLSMGTGFNSRIIFEKVHFFVANTGLKSRRIEIGCSQSNLVSVPLIFKNCLMETAISGGMPAVTPYHGKSDNSYRVSFENTVFKWSDLQSEAAEILLGFGVTLAGFNALTYEYKNCRFEGLAPSLGHKMFRPSNITASNRSRTRLLNCDLGEIRLFAPEILNTYISYGSSSAQYHDPEDGCSFEVFDAKNRMYLYEDTRKAIYWARDTSMPTLNGTQFFDGTRFSVLMRLSSNPDSVTSWLPVRGQNLTKINELGENTLKVSLEMLIDQNIDAAFRSADKYWIEVDYIDADDNFVSISTFSEAAETIDDAAHTSTAAWDRTDYVVEGVTHYFDKRKLFITTPTPVADKSSVNLRLCFGTHHPSIYDPVIFSPDFALEVVP